ncbi:hypothetical protein [Tissierella sp. Yu-01]|nr:hypothetical protein [Tissierella sp. Yu-01]WFA09573.1 hypothetical protein P3962_03195 [Tissierella sp. Yu-01]
MEKELNKGELDFLDFISKEKENEYDRIMDKLFCDYENSLFVP